MVYNREQGETMTIYIDVVFIENFMLNFIILYATGLISKNKIKLWKVAIRFFNRGLLCDSLLLYENAK